MPGCLLGTPYQGKHTSYASETSRTSNQADPPPGTIKPDQADWKNLKCEKPESHDEADLCEQRRMAEAAEQTLLLNKVQVGLGFAGAFALFITLYLTRQSNKTAIRALSNAHETAKRELRAYVSANIIAHPQIEKDTHLEVTVQADNRGQTPAYNLKVAAGMKVSEYPIPTLDPIAFQKDSPRLVLDPGTHYQYTCNWMDADGVLLRLKDPELSLVKSGKTHRLYVWGQVNYFDAFDQEHTRVFRFEFGGPLMLRGGKMWISSEGNDETTREQQNKTESRDRIAEWWPKWFRRRAHT